MITPRNTLVAGACLVLSVFSLTVGFSQESQIGSLNGNAAHGKQLYRRYCAGCHGDEGNGEGENARHLDPRPRDFTAAVFKCRSTPTGSLPLDSDLYSTLERGVHASAMPSWYPLTRQERVDLIAYIKNFSQRFREEKPQPPLPIPAEPPASSESISHGKQLFQKMECWKCHGADGHGNGPSAVTLMDSKNRPIAPYDFTSGERFKCGESNQDLYRIFMTGLDGTPMPSFMEDLKPEEAWDLVHYLRTLQKKPEGQSRQGIARIIPGKGPAKPASPQVTAEQQSIASKNH
ncbi:MAG TPA: cytochrome c [Acidobacteriota bacterium]|nr:cytochrome c [Acidobacteriota bacterium]